MLGGAFEAGLKIATSYEDALSWPRVACDPGTPLCGSVALVDRRRCRETVGVVSSGSALSSPPVGYRFPREVIAVAVRWYLRYGLSYRDVEELLAERGIEVDHVTVYRWVQMSG
jgi:hypothetical protein